MDTPGPNKKLHESLLLTWVIISSLPVFCPFLWAIVPWFERIFFRPPKEPSTIDLLPQDSGSRKPPPLPPSHTRLSPIQTDFPLPSKVSKRSWKVSAHQRNQTRLTCPLHQCKDFKTRTRVHTVRVLRVLRALGTGRPRRGREGVRHSTGRRMPASNGGRERVPTRPGGRISLNLLLLLLFLFLLLLLLTIPSSSAPLSALLILLRVFKTASILWLQPPSHIPRLLIYYCTFCHIQKPFISYKSALADDSCFFSYFFHALPFQCKIWERALVYNLRKGVDGVHKLLTDHDLPAQQFRKVWFGRLKK